jgi:chemotaxis protein CheD
VSARAAAPERPAPSGLMLPVGLGQLAASGEKGAVLSALGLGSCIGLAAYDPVARVAGLVHVMLPDSAIASHPGPPGKYADTAVPALLAALERLGADKGRLVCKMAGGAQMFASGGGLLNIGARNAIAVRAALTGAGLRLKAVDTGGNSGRTLEVAVATGDVRVRSVGKEFTAL